MTEKAILKLAAHLLKEYSEVLSNNGCNDTSDEVLSIINEIGHDNFINMAEDWNNGDCKEAVEYDWIVVGTVSHKLLKMSEELSKEE